MERREFIALIGMAAAAMPSHAGAEPTHPPDSFAGRFLGTWRFVSAVNRRSDGTSFDRWGANPKGLFMFDRAGNYSQVIVGSESRVFGAKTFCAFGTYTVDEQKNQFMTHIEGCSNYKLAGVTQTRDILQLTADELRYSNLITATGIIAEVRWKRIV